MAGRVGYCGGVNTIRFVIKSICDLGIVVRMTKKLLMVDLITFPRWV